MALQVRNAMTSNFKAVRSTLSLPDLERKFNDERVESFAVVDDGVFRGEISCLDVLRKLDERRAEAEMASGFWDEGTGVDSPLPATEWISAIVGKNMDHLQVSDVMNMHPVIAAPNESLVKLAQRMTQHKAHRAFVLDDRRLFGVVSAYDLLKLYSDGVIREIVANPPSATERKNKADCGLVRQITT